MKVLAGGLLAEPEPDCCGRDGSVEDVGPLVVTSGDRTGVLEPVDGPLDLVATPVAVPVEACRSATFSSSASAVGSLVFRLRDRVLDVASSQVTAVSAGAVRLVAADVAGPGPGPSAQRPGDSDPVQDLDHLRGITPLAWCEQEGHGAAAAFAGEVDLAGQAAPGPSETLVGAVVPGRRPFFGIRGRVLRAPAACWWARQDVESTPTIDQSIRPREVGVGLDRLQEPVPGAVRRPAAMPLIDGFPAAVAFRQVAPRDTSTDPEEDSVDHGAVVVPPAAPAT